MSYTVRVSPSGHEFQVEAGETVLEAALRQRVSMPYGCRNGACGSCRGRLLAGTVQYPEDQPHALSPEEVEDGWALLCQARARGNLHVRIREVDSVEHIEVRTLPCRLVRKTRVAHDVMALHLKLPDSERLQFLAGQYIDIIMRDGRRRAFSIANAPHEDAHLELHVRHVPGGEYSDYVFNEMPEKALMRITGPLGSFYLRDDTGRPAIFVAGGTGFAPVKAIVEQAMARGLEHPMHLYWGVRSRRDLYLHELAERWARDHELLHYVPVLSEPQPEDAWTGRTGFVHDAALADFPDLGAYDVYASGPPAMCHAVRDAFIERGLDLGALYSDAFEYAFETGHDG